jgi:hypothetical protein
MVCVGDHQGMKPYSPHRSQLLRRGAVATVSEESPHVFCIKGSQCSAHSLDEGLLATGADLPEDVVELGEGFFYRVLWSGEE